MNFALIISPLHCRVHGLMRYTMMESLFFGSADAKDKKELIDLAIHDRHEDTMYALYSTTLVQITINESGVVFHQKPYQSLLHRGLLNEPIDLLAFGERSYAILQRKQPFLIFIVSDDDQTKPSWFGVAEKDFNLHLPLGVSYQPKNKLMTIVEKTKEALLELAVHSSDERAVQRHSIHLPNEIELSVESQKRVPIAITSDNSILIGIGSEILLYKLAISNILTFDRILLKNLTKQPLVDLKVYDNYLFIATKTQLWLIRDLEELLLGEEPLQPIPICTGRGQTHRDGLFDQCDIRNITRMQVIQGDLYILCRDELYYQQQAIRRIRYIYRELFPFSLKHSTKSVLWAEKMLL